LYKGDEMSCTFRKGLEEGNNQHFALISME
jgi:hypothetical protein